jgi:hypothetical protein
MSKISRKKHISKQSIVRRFLRRVGLFIAKLWSRNIWNKIWISITVLVMLLVSGMYGIAQWYIFSHRHDPMQLGVTFIPSYAKYLGVDPQETFQAILTDLQPSQVRLVSYWDDIEKTPGVYDFSMLDWQFEMAAQHHTKITLAIGLRQPRWPECHMPAWQLNQPKDIWYPELKSVMAATINRYKDNPILQSYQLENEYFLSVFGICPDFSRDRLIDEFYFVKSLDSNHPVIISRSNNAIGFPINEPKPDEYGVSVYKRVWDKTVTKRYVEYPFPAWFYGFLAGGSILIDGRNMVIHELQAEAWTPDNYDIKTAPTSELYKSMNPERLHNRFQYAEATGIKHIDLWGVEWWYAMKVVKGDPGLWNAAHEEFDKARQQR